MPQIYYRMGNDPTLYDVRKVGRYWYQFYRDRDGVWYNCGTAHKTRKEALVGLKPA